MKVALWAEIRRLAEIDKLSGRMIARRLHCARHTVAKALELSQPPTLPAARRASLLDPYVEQIQTLLAKYPDLSAVRIREEIARGPQGYSGSATILRRYLRRVRPACGRVYQEVPYAPAQAMQVDWGECGRVHVGSTVRKVSVFVAVLCYSRLLYIEFTLSQRKAEFYRGLVNALTFFGGSPRNLIVDNLKAAVLNGSGRHSRPVKTSVHLRRLVNLAQLYGRTEVLAAMTRALELATYDAAYVENLLLAERRRRQLPTPTLPTPQRRELIDDIDLEAADPARYDRLCDDSEEDDHATT
jgi:transposase